MIPLFAGAKGKAEFKETDDEIEILSLISVSSK